MGRDGGSTLLEFFVRPALFWTLGRKAGQRVVEAHHAELELKEAETRQAEKSHETPHWTRVPWVARPPVS
ncbi:MAG: hypothetical protein ACYC35_15925 [Pirellulales bacterium]